MGSNQPGWPVAGQRLSGGRPGRPPADWAGWGELLCKFFWPFLRFLGISWGLLAPPRLCFLVFAGTVLWFCEVALHPWEILPPKQVQQRPTMLKKPKTPRTGPEDPQQPVACQAAHPVGLGSTSSWAFAVRSRSDYHLGC